ncbi:MAG TPA: hypothetical protein VEG63_03670 [Candidatus Acidoferrales bacterium]|nr:hypothetical protein [Candidatus Acidoferrales bacterium]
MTAEEKNRLIELINNPPPGSKLAAAKQYGIDLTFLVENLGRSVEERIRSGSALSESAKKLREAGARQRRGK